MVERSFAWLHAFKRLRTRYERRADIHLRLMQLACALICHTRGWSGAHRFVVELSAPTALYADGCLSASSSRAVRRLVRSCTLAKLTPSTASMRRIRSVTVL